MKVNVQAVNFNVDKKLLDFIQERMDKLEKYYDKIVSSDVLNFNYEWMGYFFKIKPKSTN